MIPPNGQRIPVEIANLAIDALEKKIANLESKAAALAAENERQRKRVADLLKQVSAVRNLTKEEGQEIAAAKARADNLVTYTVSDSFQEAPLTRKEDRVATFVLTLPSGRDLRLPGDTDPEIATEVLSLIALYYTASANRPSKKEKRENKP